MCALQDGLISGSNGHISFAHDRVHEAGYALIPKSELPQTHLKIGRLLLASTPVEELEEEIFAIIGHLNLGSALHPTVLTDGRVLAKAPADEEAVLTVSLDLSLIEDQRRGWPFLRDRRIDAYDGLGQRFID